MAEGRLALLQDLVRNNPQDVRTRYMLAMELVSQGQLEEAIEEFRQIVTLDPGYVPSYFQCGQALAEAGRVEEAKDWYRKGIAAAEQNGDLHARSEIEEALRGLGTD